MPPNLYEKLGITSPYQAAELERDFDVRFSDFTPEQCDTWIKQSVYLYLFAQTQAVTHAARAASVSVGTAKIWQSDNILGFSKRLEIANLEFTDDIEVALVQRAKDPESPPSLLTALLRAKMPDKYGPARPNNGGGAPRHHCNCDHGTEHKPPQSDNHQPSLADLQQLDNLNRQQAQPDDDALSVPEPEAQQPIAAVGPSESHLSPSPPLPSALSAPSVASPRHSGHRAAPSPQNLTRQQRRQLQRKQRKQTPYSNTAAKSKHPNSHRPRAPN